MSTTKPKTKEERNAEFERHRKDPTYGMFTIRRYEK